MNRKITKSTAIACSLALTVSAFAANAFARGSGHSSGGMGHFNHSMSTSHNFVRTPTNFSSGNSHVSSHHFSKNQSPRTNFVSNKFQKMTMHKFSKSKAPFWKKYCGGWGYCGLWGCDYGWGWGCWDSPWCYGWCWYEPVPVVAYYNPYCDCAGNVVDGIDYSGPISQMPTNSVAGDDSDSFAAARAAFAEGNLDEALNAISIAALQAPQSQDMHQFHALVLFAKGDYCKASAVAHAVLQAGPGWTWNTLQGFYASPEVYTQQLRQLEHYVGERPAEPNARFLLGYHYLMLNHAETAQRQLQQVAEMQPKDKLAKNILSGMKNAESAKLAADTAPAKSAPINNASAKLETISQAGASSAKVKPVADEKVGTVSVNPATKDDADDDTQTTTALKTPGTPSNVLTGTFKASPVKDVQIELTLKDDKAFTWKFTANGKSQSFSGKYQLGPNSLALTRTDGETMDGTLERLADASFKFRMKDAESDDPGLTFTR